MKSKITAVLGLVLVLALLIHPTVIPAQKNHYRSRSRQIRGSESHGMRNRCQCHLFK